MSKYIIIGLQPDSFPCLNNFKAVGAMSSRPSYSLRSCIPHEKAGFYIWVNIINLRQKHVKNKVRQDAAL